MGNLRSFRRQIHVFTVSQTVKQKSRNFGSKLFKFLSARILQKECVQSKFFLKNTVKSNKYCFDF